jgi:hypothetical protein
MTLRTRLTRIEQQAAARRLHEHAPAALYHALDPEGNRLFAELTCGDDPFPPECPDPRMVELWPHREAFRTLARTMADPACPLNALVQRDPCNEQALEEKGAE